LFIVQLTVNDLLLNGVVPVIVGAVMGGAVVHNWQVHNNTYYKIILHLVTYVHELVCTYTKHWYIQFAVSHYKFTIYSTVYINI